MKLMKRLIAVLLIVLMVSVVGLAVFAEEDPGDPPAGGETSGTDSTGEENERKISVTGNLDGVSLYFNGSETSAKSLTVPLNTTVTFTVKVEEHYTLNSIKLNGVLTLKPDDGGVYSFDVDADADAYSIRVSATYNPPDDPSDGNSDDISGDDSGDVSGDNSDDTSGDVSGDDSDDTSGDVSGDGSDDISGDNSGDHSGDTSADSNLCPLEITISGKGTVTVGGKTLTESGTVQLPSGVATSIRLEPSYGYSLTAIYLDGGYHTVNQNLTLTITERTTLRITFSAASVTPTNYKVTLTVTTDGGYVSASGQTANKDASQQITVSAGSSLPINVFPANDYEVDSFRVNGTARNLTNGSFMLSAIGSDTEISVSFKKVEKAKTSLEASDLNWSADSDGNIVVDTGNYTVIGKSVFDKINSLNSGAGDNVILQTPYIRWYIPCGSQITGVSADEFQLRISLNGNGSYYQTIQASINAQDASTLFNYYEAEKLPTFPEGTKASFQMADYASKYAGNNVNLMVKSENALVVCGTGSIQSDGWTTPMDYQTSRYMVVRIETAQYYTVTAEAGTGGKITPSGSNSVAFESDFSISVEANGGYIISAVYVDHIPVAGAAGGLTFSHKLTSVTGSHEIRAEFIPSGSNYTVVNNVAVLQGETSGDDTNKPNVGLIVALVIVFVAVAGAAVLFIVKWRQEKF